MRANLLQAPLRSANGEDVFRIELRAAIAAAEDAGRTIDQTIAARARV